ncbi:MAG: hypothetical protein R3C45_19430 [Phycisphaerales bacterium]
MPEAQLDRFMLKLDVGYSTREELHEIANRTTRAEQPKIESVLDEDHRLPAAHPPGHHRPARAGLRDPQRARDPPEGEYASKLSRQFLRFGGSPRAVQALVLGGKVPRPLLDGRARSRSTTSVRHAPRACATACC